MFSNPSCLPSSQTPLVSSCSSSLACCYSIPTGFALKAIALSYIDSTSDCSLVYPPLPPLSLLLCLLPLPSSASSCPTSFSTTVTFNSKLSSLPTYLHKSSKFATSRAYEQTSKTQHTKRVATTSAAGTDCGQLMVLPRMVKRIWMPKQMVVSAKAITR